MIFVFFNKNKNKNKLRFLKIIGWFEYNQFTKETDKALLKSLNAMGCIASSQVP